MKVRSYSYCKAQTVLDFTDMEGTGPVGHATEQPEELNLHPCETKVVRKMNTFSSGRNSDHHQQPTEGTSPGDSLELQQPTVARHSKQKDVPQPSAGYNDEREKTKKMPKAQNNVGDHVAVVATEV